MFKRFHLAYIDVTSNPFYQMGQVRCVPVCLAHCYALKRIER